MTASHRAAATALVENDPDQAGKIVPLDPAGDVADPIGMGQDAYDSLAQRFTELIPNRLKEMLADEDRARIRSSRR
jgi:hypothetical protein